MSKMGETALELEELAADNLAVFIETGVRPEYNGEFREFYESKFQTYLEEFDNWMDAQAEDAVDAVVDARSNSIDPLTEDVGLADKYRDWDQMADEYYGMTQMEDGMPIPGSW